jgi:hypothetical protein
LATAERRFTPRSLSAEIQPAAKMIAPKMNSPARYVYSLIVVANIARPLVLYRFLFDSLHIGECDENMPRGPMLFDVV